MSLPDTMFIFALALVIFGPKKLPEIGRQVGKLVFEFRRASNEFKMQIEEELRSAEDADRQKQRLAAAAVASASSEATSESSNSLTVKPPSTGTMVSAEHPNRPASLPDESGYAENGYDENGYVVEDAWQEEAYPAVTTDSRQSLPNGLQEDSGNSAQDGMREDDEQRQSWAETSAPPPATVTTSELSQLPATATVRNVENFSAGPGEGIRAPQEAPEIEAPQAHAASILAVHGAASGQEAGHTDLREPITNHHG